MRTRAMTILLMFAASGLAFASSCDKKEYAQYKDMASTEIGQLGLGGDYCQLKIRRKANADLAALAAQYGRRGDYEIASADESGCAAELSKINTVLTTTKSLKAHQYIQKNCP